MAEGREAGAGRTKLALKQRERVDEFDERRVASTGEESDVWVRGITGVLLCVVGVVWIAQGTNVLHGSGMSGHGIYAVLGVVVFVIGAALLAWAWRVRNAQTP
ncbi:MAG TPA: hypothetical protein VGZ68_03665 [Acidimicrobiales bacterium]|nr:hypothetical protein [Acidimicrobiales bacterium]